MLSNLHKEKAQFYYYQALVHIRGIDEQATSIALNAARETVLNGRHFTELKNTDLQHVAENLTEYKFNALHGDHGYSLKSQWVPASLLPMVDQHYEELKKSFGEIRDDRGQVISWDDYVAKKYNAANSLTPSIHVA
jgi:hypothetical protein